MNPRVPPQKLRQNNGESLTTEGKGEINDSQNERW